MTRPRERSMREKFPATNRMPAKLRGASIALAALVVCALPAGSARAQPPYPSQGIRLIVPYAARGVPDTVARLVRQHPQERIGQAGGVENRPGGDGSVPAAPVTAAPAPGATPPRD